ncbi:SH3 domain-containing protein [Balneicella halophila]|uniref:SH3 domain-containing protein n=1 Tax=Balneicella halophila TaxID=1537566 RepID=A0A7L4US61_BALHA|nr:tetratricopeptide repeat protein [Balneicella halophila]PVX52499.1 SH3 domain-containing protein [Balneicella halophila]
MIQKINILFTLLLITSLSWGQDTAFTKGNEQYKEGNYNEAISNYENVLKNEGEAASVYYNLGNAYFKKGDLASAILNYERAYRLNPSDKDIRANLAYANAQKVDKIEKPQRVFFFRWIQLLVEEFHSNTWAYIGIAFWAVLFIFLTLFIRTFSEKKRKIFFSFILFSLLISLFSFYASYSQYSVNENKTHAIVFAQNITAKSTPSNNGTDLFILHPGTKVKVLDKVGNWYKIQLADEREGWLPAKEVVKI